MEKQHSWRYNYKNNRFLTTAQLVPQNYPASGETDFSEGLEHHRERRRAVVEWRKVRNFDIYWICAHSCTKWHKNHKKTTDWQLLWIAIRFRLAALRLQEAECVHIFNRLNIFFLFLHWKPSLLFIQVKFMFTPLSSGWVVKKYFYRKRKEENCFFDKKTIKR